MYSTLSSAPGLKSNNSRERGVFHAVNASTASSSDSDEKGEEDDEVKRTLAERAVHQDIQEVKYEMQEMKNGSLSGYREMSAPLLNAPDLFALTHFDRQCLHWHWLSQWRQAVLAWSPPLRGLKISIARSKSITA
jgi:hypothetical protein